jgi:O-antigen ligase
MTSSKERRAGFLSSLRFAFSRTEPIETLIAWLFIASLAWTPFWYGSNDLFAWGVNALLFCGLAVAFELSLLVRSRPHPIGLLQIRYPAALFLAVLIWTVMQNTTGLFAHPIWQLAANVLQRPLPGTISINGDLTILAIVRLMTSVAVFWLALELSESRSRASLILHGVVAIGVAYCGYGLLVFAESFNRALWQATPPKYTFVSSTFVNQNSFATFAGLCLLVACGLAVRGSYASMALPMRRPWRALIDRLAMPELLLIAASALMVVSLTLTSSRGGILAAMGGFAVFLGLLVARHAQGRAVAFLGVLAVVVVCAVLGQALVLSFVTKGLFDPGRLAVYRLTLQSIADAPWTGFGLGTFLDVFPMYRDHSLTLNEVWEQAHNTYLEVFQGLGLVFGSLFLASIGILGFVCLQAALRRRDSAIFPCIAASVTALVAIHAMFDFSLQIEAIALIFAAVLGTGVAHAQAGRPHA